MKSFLRNLAIAGSLCAFAGSASAEMTIQELEQAVKRLKQSTKSQKKEISRLDMSGYVAVGIAKTDAPIAYEGGFAPAVQPKVQTDQQTKAGIQFDYKINNKTSATVQLLATGASDYDVSMEYGFIKWDLFDDHSFRFGRLRVPLYKYSDSLNVTYAQPWGVQPSEIYGISPVNTMNGIDYLGYFETGDFLHTVNVFGGTSSPPGDGSFSNGTFRNVAGASLATEWNNFSVRGLYLSTVWSDPSFWQNAAIQLLQGAGVVCATINEQPSLSFPVAGPGPIPVPAAGAANGCTTTPVPEAIQFEEHALQALTVQSLDPLDDLNVEFLSAAAEYNHPLFYVIGEWAETRIAGIFPDYDASYVTLGFNLPFNLSPYYTVGSIKTEDDDERANPAFTVIPGTVTPYNDSFIVRDINVRQKSDRLGVRWDATESIAVFLDAERLHEFEGTPGLFDTEVNTLASQRQINRDDEHYIYRFTIAARF